MVWNVLSHQNNEVWGSAFAGLPENKSYPLQRPRNEGQLRSLGGLDQVQSGRRIDAEGQGTESDTCLLYTSDAADDYLTV